MAKTLISIRVDESLISRAKRALRTPTRSRTIEKALEAVVEMERHQKLIRRFSGRARPGDFELS
jgi:Arc/MetJ family transcription regulator